MLLLILTVLNRHSVTLSSSLLRTGSIRANIPRVLREITSLRCQALFQHSCGRGTHDPVELLPAVPCRKDKSGVQAPRDYFQGMTVLKI